MDSPYGPDSSGGPDPLEGLDTHDGLDTCDGPDTTTVSDNADSPDSPDGTDTSDGPHNPDGPDIPDGPDTPDGADIPVGSDNPHDPDTPDGPDTPYSLGTSDDPDPSDVPDTSEGPSTPVGPITSDGCSTSESPRVSHGPNAQDGPESPAPLAALLDRAISEEAEVPAPLSVPADGPPSPNAADYDDEEHALQVAKVVPAKEKNDKNESACPLEKVNKREITKSPLNELVRTSTPKTSTAEMDTLMEVNVHRLSGEVQHTGSRLNDGARESSQDGTLCEQATLASETPPKSSQLSDWNVMIKHFHTNASGDCILWSSMQKQYLNGIQHANDVLT
uniref:sporozoite surface protein 2-like n=1 Tax=Jaculus jaculus TaxID=51337 RepID=UPI001E1B59FA|nr:sporozoite surface protein 2-like [Jaculus jaculus]